MANLEVFKMKSEPQAIKSNIIQLNINKTLTIEHEKKSLDLIQKKFNENLNKKSTGRILSKNSLKIMEFNALIILHKLL